MNYRSKLPNVETTIFTVMSRLAHEHDALNLSQGFPNFDTDPELIDLVTQAMKDGYNQYAPMAGIYSLREKIARKTESLYGHAYDPESEITVTVGATQAIFTIISTFIGKGDEVIVFKPAYDCYEPAIELHGGIPVLIPMKVPDFTIDWQEVEQRISPKTKMILINSPHNPSGTVLTENDMLELERLTQNTDIIVLSDEVYEHMVFDGRQHHSIARYPKLVERSFLTASFGKTFHNTGWKTGYCAGPAHLMAEFRKVHQFNVFCTNHPVQRAFAAYLQEPSHYTDLNGFYQKKRDFFLAGLEGSRFKWKPSQGTYFQLLDYSSISDEPDTVFAERLVKEHGIASIPISEFMLDRTDHKLLRFCFAKTEDTLKKAGDILLGV